MSPRSVDVVADCNSTTSPDESRLDALARAIAGCAERLAHIERLLEIVPVLLAAHADPTHIAVPDAARILNVSQRTIRRKIQRGELRLDVVADGRKTGIPIEQLYEAWIPWSVAKQSYERAKREAARVRRHDGAHK